MKHHKLAFCLLMLVSVLAVGCCGRVPVFPIGAYVGRTLGQDVILDFGQNGTYSAVKAGNRVIADSAYRPAGDTITFAADPPCLDEATYVWTLVGETLTFEVRGEDYCLDRRDYLQDTIYTCVTCT